MRRCVASRKPNCARQLDAPEVIFARIAADQKLRIVEALKQQGHVVAVTGDGVNDAPALKNAHVGVAMGIMGTDVAKEAADVVLLDDNFASIVNAIEEGRAVFENIRKFLTYILAHNVPELVPYLAFSLFAIPLPLTPIQILTIDMGTDSLTALGLGVEAPDPDVMRRPPRGRGDRLFTWSLALRAYLFLGAIEAVAAMATFFFVLHGAGWAYGLTLAPSDPLYLRATTACLSAVIVMQIVNVFLCRSTTRSVWSVGLLGNRLILWGVVLEVVLILAIDYTAWGNRDLRYRADLGARVAVRAALRHRSRRARRAAKVLSPGCSSSVTHEHTAVPPNAASVHSCRPHTGVSGQARRWTELIVLVFIRRVARRANRHELRVPPYRHGQPGGNRRALSRAVRRSRVGTVGATSGSKLGQLTAMWNHGPVMENEANRRSVTLPTLSGQELSDITTYLAGVGGGLKTR